MLHTPMRVGKNCDLHRVHPFQFTTYTDLIPLQVIAMYLNESLHVYMMIRYLDGIYEMDIDSNTLNAMLRSAAQSTPGIPTPPIS